ncbi:MAG TPA: hypothetical protein VHL09_03035 [Dehalococcoidia bacterium]|nr:hypothetical protein [Dehalococcoidia bacterium]
MTDPTVPAVLIIPLILIGLFLMIYPPLARARRRNRRRAERRRR